MRHDPDVARGLPEKLGDRVGVEPGDDTEHDHLGLRRRELGEQRYRGLLEAQGDEQKIKEDNILVELTGIEPVTS